MCIWIAQVRGPEVPHLPVDRKQIADRGMSTDDAFAETVAVRGLITSVETGCRERHSYCLFSKCPAPLRSGAKGEIAMKNQAALVLLTCLASPLFGQEKETARLKESYHVLKEIMDTPDKGIPRPLLDKSVCVVVFPSVKKAAIGLGGSYGRGVITCRSGEDFGGPWSAPAMFALEGLSFGFQLGGQATDFVLLIMNEKGANSVMSSKVKLGADASAAAGPVGRTTSAETDVFMAAEILSWSRSRGLFGGISLAGSTLRSDDNANKEFYGEHLRAREIVREGKVKMPDAAKLLIELLESTCPKHIS